MAFLMEWKLIQEFTFCVLLLTSTVSGAQGVNVSDQEQKFTVMPESVEVNAGDAVFLSCVVQNQQGKTQWTKDGFALGFERDVPGYPRYSYAGDSSHGEHHLVINGATLEDDGEYQCQVGPTATTSSLWAAANVTVMVSPSSINVIGGGGEGTKVEAVEGQALQLQCVVRDARPAPSVAWYRNGLMMDQDLHTERLEISSQARRWSVRSRLVIVPEAADDGQQYSCRALHPSLMNSPTSLVASVTLSVLHPPKPPVISGYSTGEVLKEGEVATLTCESAGGNPRPKLTWYRNGRLLNRMNFTQAESSEEHQGAKMSVKVKVKPEDDRAIYECRATNDILDNWLSDNVTFAVNYSPSRVVVTGPSVAAAGQEFTLTCVTSRANPSASINWLVHGVQIATVSSLVSEADDGGWVTSSDLKYHLERSLRLAEVTVECKAHNSASDKVISETRLVSIIKPPGRPILQVEGVGDIVAGGRLVVVCSSEGGNPHPGVTIYKGHEKLVTEVILDGRVTRARAVTEVMAADNGAKVTCEVTNPATDIPLLARADIELFFPPWEVSAWVSPSNVAAGQVVKLICESSSSLPSSTITWRSGSLTLHGATSAHTSGLYGGKVTRSELEVRALIEDNDRLFTCDANNGLGVTVTTNVTLNVLHEPVWIVVPTGIVEIREKDDLILRAAADANPPPITYSWWRGPLMIEGVKSEEGREEGRLEMKRVHRQEAGGYSVTASSPRGTVNASFVINVLYGPESMMAPKRVTVDDDGSTTILCSAIGNPAPNITWFRQDHNNSAHEVLSWGISEARLLIDFVTRADTGFYKCLASNIVTTSPIISTAVVVTQAPELPEEEYMGEELTNRPWAMLGGTGRLECTVRAAPAPNFRWTINEERVLFNSRKYFIRRPQLIDGLVEWSSVLEIRSVSLRDYTTYTCTTTNSRGTYTSNHTLGPPVPPGQPQELNVTSVIGSTAALSWLPPSQGTSPSGYALRYRPLKEENYSHVEVTGSDVSTVKIQGLSAGIEYEFTIQSFNDQGRSKYTSQPIHVTVPGVVEEVASSSSQPRVPRLTLLLMSLTGAALLVLNISIIVCFVKRFALNRSTPASSFKTSASETYTPASTPGLTTDDDGRTTSSDTVSSPPQYQITRQSSIKKEEGGGSGLIIHHLNTENVESSKPKDRPIISLPISADQFVTVNSPSKMSKSALINGGLNMRNMPSPTPKTESTSNEKSSDKYTEWTSDTSKLLDDSISRRMKVTVHPSDIPDVCPKSPSSSCSLARHQSQELMCSEDDRISLTSHQSSTSYVNLHDPVHGLGRHTPISLRHQDSMSPPLVLMHSTPSKLLSMSSRHDSSARSSISEKSQSQEAPPPSTCCSSKSGPQVIYHGQPHIQHQHDQQQYQEHLEHLDHRQTLEEPPHHDYHQHLDHQLHLEHQDPFEFQQGQHEEIQNAAAPYGPPAENREFFPMVPCCHQPTPHLHMPEYEGHHEHHHLHHHQHTPLHHLQYLEHQSASYPLNNSPNLPQHNTTYSFSPSEYHLSMHHPSSHYLQSLEDSNSSHQMQGLSDHHKSIRSTKHHTPREYQYPIPFTEEDYRSYPQHPTEQHPLQCIREEPSNDLSQYSGLDPSSLYTLETDCDEDFGQQESSVEMAVD